MTRKASKSESFMYQELTPVELQNSKYLSKKNKQQIQFHQEIDFPFELEEQITIINQHYSNYNTDKFSFITIVSLLSILISCLIVLYNYFFSKHDYNSFSKILNDFNLKFPSNTVLFLKIFLLACLLVIGVIVIIAIIRFHDKKNETNQQIEETKYYNELILLLESVGIKLDHEYSLKSDVDVLDGFIGTLDVKQKNLRLNAINNKVKATDNGKWMITLVVAMTAPIIANNLSIFMTYFKSKLILLFGFLITFTDLYAIYKLSIKPITFTFSLESKIDNIKPVIYKLKYKLKNNQLEKRKKQKDDKTN